MDDISSIVSRRTPAVVVCSVTGSQWIATGFVLAMTRVRKGRDGKGGIVLCVFVIARKERSEGRGNPSCLGGRGQS